MKKGDIIEVKCPKCGHVGDNRFLKSWMIKGRGGVETKILSFKCLTCRRKWRRGDFIKREKYVKERFH